MYTTQGGARRKGQERERERERERGDRQLLFFGDFHMGVLGGGGRIDKNKKREKRKEEERPSFLPGRSKSNKNIFIALFFLLRMRSILHISPSLLVEISEIKGLNHLKHLVVKY